MLSTPKQAEITGHEMLNWPAVPAAPGNQRNANILMLPRPESVECLAQCYPRTAVLVHRAWKPL